MFKDCSLIASVKLHLYGCSFLRPDKALKLFEAEEASKHRPG